MKDRAIRKIILNSTKQNVLVVAYKINGAIDSYCVTNEITGNQRRFVGNDPVGKKYVSLLVHQEGSGMILENNFDELYKRAQAEVSAQLARGNKQYSDLLPQENKTPIKRKTPEQRAMEKQTLKNKAEYRKQQERIAKEQERVARERQEAIEEAKYYEELQRIAKTAASRKVKEEKARQEKANAAYEKRAKEGHYKPIGKYEKTFYNSLFI